MADNCSVPRIDQRDKARERITAALVRAAKHARESHRRTGTPLHIWRNGRTEAVPPDQIHP
jgi:hypothetical protein